MIVVWVLLYFPFRDAEGTPYYERIEAAEKQAKEAAGQTQKLKDDGQEVPEELEAKVAEPDRLNGEWKRRSALGRAGLFLEPVFRPLGWDWKIGMAALASFPAREVIVGTLGLIYDVGDVDTKAIGDDSADAEAKEKAAGLTKAVREDWSKDPIRGKYGISVAVSLMVFFALCCQCASTLAVIRRETQSWWWPAFTFSYMTVLAYLGALISFQLGAFITDMVG
jgi:ferrous iron transport protein B